MPLFKKSLAGPGYIVLNVIRVMNIIGLIAVIVASSVMLVKTFVISKFFFFDAVSHIITACLSFFLIITELPFFRSYIAFNWPLLSPSSGFVTLGIIMIILGVSILGNLNKEATSQESLGFSYWSIVIASGIIVSILGVINIITSYLFRNTSIDVTARMVRAHGAVAPQKAISSPRSSHSSNYSRRRSFHLGRADSLPTYRTSTSQMPMAQDPRRNISAPLNNLNPAQFSKFDRRGDDIEQPDLAHHPALNGRMI